MYLILCLCSHSHCRELLKGADDPSAAFLDVCEHFHPVFRYFFIETFADPVRWFTSRMAYTRSVAVRAYILY